eukprot:m.113109 g.113109  ORF g.113109 m.113109 type:complete len:246 (+) comp16226_c0_seq1:951-1688(+)
MPHRYDCQATCRLSQFGNPANVECAFSGQGTRVVGLVHGAGLKKTNYDSFEKMHAADWLPTLVSMASGRDWAEFVSDDEPPYLPGDGINVWPMLSEGAPSPRKFILHEAHPGVSSDVHGDGLTVGDMKLVLITKNPEPGWFPPPGQDPAKVTYKIKCPKPAPPVDPKQCTKTYCLFNVTADPCEHVDLASEHPDIVQDLKQQLQQFKRAAVPPVVGQGCQPVKVNVNGTLVWKPCDAPLLGKLDN